MFLFLDLKVFVSWIFVSVDLHIGYMSLFWRDGNGNGLQTKGLLISSLLSKVTVYTPDQLQQSLGREESGMRGTWQQQHQQKRLPLMRPQQMPRWSRHFVLHGRSARKFDDELSSSGNEEIPHLISSNIYERFSTYSFTVPEVMSASVVHLWLGFLMRDGCSDFFYSALNSRIINGRQRCRWGSVAKENFN